MCIVYDYGISARRVQGLEPPGHRHQQAHLAQHLVGVLPQQTGSSVDGQQVVGIELAHEHHLYRLAVDFEGHAVDTALDDPGLEVGHRPQRVGMLLGPRVLQHHQARLVVDIGQGKRALGQSVEERLLGLQIGLYRLVIVDVVACQVGKDGPVEIEPGNAVLGCRVRTHLHEGILATGIDHLAQQTVQMQRVGGGVGSGNLHRIDVVAHRREEPRLVTQRAEHLVQQCGRGRLAVGTGYPHQRKLARGIAIPSRGQHAESYRTVIDFYIRHLAIQLGGKLFTNNHLGPLCHGLGDKGMTIDRRTAHSHKQVAGFYLAGVRLHTRHLAHGRALALDHCNSR